MPADSGARRPSHLPLSGYRFSFYRRAFFFLVFLHIRAGIRMKHWKKKETKQIWTMQHEEIDGKKHDRK